MRPLLLLLLLTCFSGHSQVQANIWYFGNKAGVDFTSGNPVPLFNGQLNTIEGCTTLADDTGNILFYTNGVTVWNKYNIPMANGSGLMGDLSSSQAAVIIPKPNAPLQYYIFTTNPFPGGGFRYSEVDMNLNNGIGAVTLKNVLLYGPTCEKVAVVKHANGEDLWVVTHSFGSDTFNAHLVSASGIAPAVTSNAGLNVVTNDDVANAIGYMKISPDGTKLIACHTYLMKAELFDFDASTGTVSNPQMLSDEGLHVYGAEFSTDSRKLYIGTVDEKKVIQYDLESADIAGSAFTVATLSQFVGALQLAPNGKIYIAMAETDRLSVINIPELAGNDCELVADAVDLGGRMCMLGLPSFDASLFNHNIKIDKKCSGGNSILTVTTGQTMNSVVWNFGDGNTSEEFSPSHIYAAGGNYTVTCTATNVNCTIVKTSKISISETPVANPAPVQNICLGSSSYLLSQNDEQILNGQQASIAYFASVEDAENNINPLSDEVSIISGTNIFCARVQADGSDCFATTSFTVNGALQPVASQPEALKMCESFPHNGSEAFDLTSKNAEILNGQDPAEFSVSYHHSSDEADLGANPIASPYFNTLELETIYARVSNSSNTCSATTTLTLRLIAQPKDTFVTDFEICDDEIRDGFASFDLETKNQEVLGNLSAENYNVTYHLSQNDADNNVSPLPMIYVNTAQQQTIFVRIEHVEGSCKVVLPILLIVKECPDEPSPIAYSIPKFFSPNGDGHNDQWQVKLSDSQIELSISIFDRNGILVKSMSCHDTGWDGKINSRELPADDYWYQITDSRNNTSQGHFSLLR